MKPRSERNLAIAARRAEGATLKAIAAEFNLKVERIRGIADRVERYDRGMAILRDDPFNLDGLELTGRLPRLVRSSLEAVGIARLEDLDGIPLDELLKWPNIGRRSASILLGLLGELHRSQLNDGG